ncbi:MAG: hypothetical protein HGA50_04335, partial [Deltaproteobacteria bacterium]|nr:hypothetical protein [Deltaproteobacteria bacterium]
MNSPRFHVSYSRIEGSIVEGVNTMNTHTLSSHSNNSRSARRLGSWLPAFLFFALIPLLSFASPAYSWVLNIECPDGPKDRHIVYADWGTGNGTYTGDINGVYSIPVIPDGATVTLTAIPYVGSGPYWMFLQYDGDFISFINPDSFTMDSDKHVQVKMINIGQYTLTIFMSGSGSGRVQASAGSVSGLGGGTAFTSNTVFSYPDLDIVTLTPLPNTGSVFDHWATGSGSMTFAGANLTADAVFTNSPPTISDISDQTINEDSNTGSLAFTVGDTETAPANLMVVASSNNTTLVPNNVANLTLGGSGTNRTLVVTPASDQSGTATITVTVQDEGGLTASDMFTFSVTPVNDPPLLDPLSNPPAVNEDAGAQTVAAFATGMSPGGGADEAGQTLTFVVTANTNAALFSSGPAIDATTGTLTYTPAAQA